jgi:hypothetical protein
MGAHVDALQATTPLPEVDPVFATGAGGATQAAH